MSEEIDPQKMPQASRDPELWEEYFLKVCDERLRLTLEKEKERYYDPNPYESLQDSMIHHFKTLGDILKNPDVPPRKCTSSYDELVMDWLREEISKLISEKLH